MAIIRSLVEIFDANHSARPRQFGGELVLDIPADVGDLLMLAGYPESLFLIVVAENGSACLWVFGLLLFTERTLHLAEFFEMVRERLLVLKASPIANSGSLLDAHIHPHNSRGSGRALFLDLHLKGDVPMTSFTGDGCPQNLD